jgi:hypothetical protein
MVLAGAAIAAAFGAPAAALDDASGTYTGKVKCTYIDGGNPLKEKFDITVRLVDEKYSDRMAIDTDGGVFTPTVIGQVLASTDKPDRGKFAGLTCTLSPETQNGSAVHSDIVIKPGSEKGSIKGTIFIYQLGTAGICSFSAKRTSTTPPEVFLCV